MSGREKDKLFHQVHGSASLDSGTVAPSANKIAALQELRDEVSQLKNQLLNKDGKLPTMHYILSSGAVTQIAGEQGSIPLVESPTFCGVRHFVICLIRLSELPA